jgi:hypothetical protein
MSSPANRATLLLNFNCVSKSCSIRIDNVFNLNGILVHPRIFKVWPLPLWNSMGSILFLGFTLFVAVSSISVSYPFFQLIAELVSVFQRQGFCFWSLGRISSWINYLAF